MDTLTAKEYYELSYNVIADNKVRQVTGTYNQTTYKDATEEKSYTSVSNLKGNTSRSWTLPAVSKSLWDTTDNYFQGNFFQLTASYESSQPSSAKYREERTEIVYADVYIDIYNDNPMKYESGVYISSAEGTNRIRVAQASTHNPGWANNFSSDQASVFGIANYNRNGVKSTKSESTTVGIHDVKSVTVISYDGTTIDPVKNQYRLRLKITIPVYYAHMYCLITEGEYEYVDEAELEYDMYTSVKLTIPYKVRGDDETVDFDYHTEDADYSSYPLSITGNEFTANTSGLLYDKLEKLVVNSSGEYVNSHGNRIVLRHLYNTKTVQWSEWVSQQIMNKYRNGKLYITAKISLNTAAKYSLNIDSEFLIKDTNNHYLRNYKDGYLYLMSFKVKNIEYECTETGYYATITLLEDEGVPYEVYVVNGDNEYVVESTNTKLVYKKEEY